MHKPYGISKKARSPVSWHKHLRKEGKRAVNKAFRKVVEA
jgi:hypothetical protein